jgi:hypothetical protein
MDTDLSQILAVPPLFAQQVYAVQRPNGLFLTRDGSWFHDGQLVRHKRLSTLLHRSICRGDCGRLGVSTGLDFLFFQSEDAPFRILSWNQSKNGLSYRLSDDSEERLAEKGIIRIDAQGHMRTPVKQGQFWALLSRSATQYFHDKISPTQNPACFQVIGTDARIQEINSPQLWHDPPAFS